ncbi:hypothetical protein [Methylobacterium sp. GXS13]|nr:hypothetical protein [Methylobacterium sp. GXS13]
MQLTDQKIIDLGLDSSGIDESDIPGAVGAEALACASTDHVVET